MTAWEREKGGKKEEPKRRGLIPTSVPNPLFGPRFFSFFFPSMFCPDTSATTPTHPELEVAADGIVVHDSGAAGQVQVEREAGAKHSSVRRLASPPRSLSHSLCSFFITHCRSVSFSWAVSSLPCVCFRLSLSVKLSLATLERLLFRTIYPASQLHLTPAVLVPNSRHVLLKCPCLSQIRSFCNPMPRLVPNSRALLQPAAGGGPAAGPNRRACRGRALRMVQELSRHGPARQDAVSDLPANVRRVWKCGI